MTNNYEESILRGVKVSNFHVADFIISYTIVTALALQFCNFD